MNGHSSAGFEAQLRSVLATVRSEDYLHHEVRAPAPPAAPFITISRQAGAGGWTLAQRLVERLNQIDPQKDRPWTCWDRELVEKVAADHNISQELIDTVEESTRSWLDDFLAGLSYSSEAAYPDDLTVYRRVAQTMRALAHVGRVVIVGRGGVCITRNLPSGVHVRLVAPLPFRVQWMARKLDAPEKTAAEHVRQMDRARDAFYRRYWPNHPLVPEMFTITLNASLVGEERMAESILPLVVLPERIQTHSTARAPAWPQDVEVSR